MMQFPPFTLRDAGMVAHVQAALAARPRGLFTDIDGTISPIAPTPEAARLLPGTRDLLERLRDTFDYVAAVSGRAAENARAMVGVEGIAYIGNHGFERLTPEGVLVVFPEALPYRATLEETLAAVERDLMLRLPGLRIEPKGVTASIHVRNTSDPISAEEAVFAAATAMARGKGLRVTRGKMVVELRPPVEVDKGVAIEEAIRSHGLNGAFYLGDDRTDMDAFRALRRLTREGVSRGVAVGVLQAEAPAGLAEEADLTLSSIEAVPGFLRWLLDNA